jgi:hypothetical protein
MTVARPGIIMPASPGASKEVRVREVSVMPLSKPTVAERVKLLPRVTIGLPLDWGTEAGEESSTRMLTTVDVPLK